MKSEWPEAQGAWESGPEREEGCGWGSTHGYPRTGCADEGPCQLRGPACCAHQNTSLGGRRGPGGGRLGSAGPVRPPDL